MNILVLKNDLFKFNAHARLSDNTMHKSESITAIIIIHTNIFLGKFQYTLTTFISN